MSDPFLPRRQETDSSEQLTKGVRVNKDDFSLSTLPRAVRAEPWAVEPTRVDTSTETTETPPPRPASPPLLHPVRVASGGHGETSEGMSVSTKVSRNLSCLEDEVEHRGETRKTDATVVVPDPRVVGCGLRRGSGTRGPPWDGRTPGPFQRRTFSQSRPGTSNQDTEPLRPTPDTVTWSGTDVRDRLGGPGLDEIWVEK